MQDQMAGGYMGMMQGMVPMMGPDQAYNQMPFDPAQMRHQVH